MNAPLRHSDALDAYADMLITYSDRRVRLAATLAVCGMLGLCVALLMLSTFWTLEQHAATANSAAASQSSGSPARSEYDCLHRGATAPRAISGGALHSCDHTLGYHAASAAMTWQALVEPVYD